MVGLLLSSSSLLPKFVILAQVIESVNVLLRYVCNRLRANSTLTGVNEVVEHGSGQEEGNIRVDKFNRSRSMDGSFCV